MREAVEREGAALAVVVGAKHEEEVLKRTTSVMVQMTSEIAPTTLISVFGSAA
ncbi:MAG: hypothetical protein U0235_24010 [Polyangiaceae bacterium]